MTDPINKDPIYDMSSEQLIEEVKRLRRNNHELNARVMTEGAKWQSKSDEESEVQKYKNKAIFYEELCNYNTDNWSFEFNRTCADHHELGEIYKALYRASGLPIPAFHSVMDSLFHGDGTKGHVEANVYLSEKGGIKSERVVDAVIKYLRGTWKPINSTYFARNQIGSLEEPAGETNIAHT